MELGRLPEDLSDTYAQIFEHVRKLGPQSHVIAERSLKWLLCQARDISEAEFLSAVSIGTERESVNLTKEKVLFICGNLVVFDHELKVFRFAHLSVREFLETQSNFTLGAAHALGAEISLLVCLHRYTELAAKYARRFRRYAFVYWLYHCREAKKSGLSGPLHHLLGDFLHIQDGTNLCYAAWVQSLHRLRCASHGESDNWIVESDDELINGVLKEWRPAIYASRSDFKLAEDLAEHMIRDTILGDQNYSYDPTFAACFLDLPEIVEQNLRSVLSSPAKKVGDLAIVNTALFARRNVRQQTYLHVACHSGSSKLLRLLLHYPVPVRAMDDLRRTALHYAVHPESLIFQSRRWTETVRNGHDQAIAAERVSMIGLLIEKGSIIDAADHEGETALYRACSVNLVTESQCLLEHGAFVDAKTYKDQTPLHLAVELGHTTVARILLQFKADIEARDFGGKTPLLLAVRSGYTAITQLLLQFKANTEARHNNGRTPLLLAVGSGYTAITQLLLQFKADTEARGYDGRTPLLLAVGSGYTAITQLLLLFKADTEARDYDGRTPLLLAVGLGYTAITRLLLQSKADTEARDSNQRTPLFQTVMKGDIDTGRLLLRLGADINAKDRDGITPLAESLHMKNEAVAQMLIDEGASVNELDLIGNTALHYAANSWLQAMVSRLLEMGDHKNGTNVYGSTPLHVALNAEKEVHGASQTVQLLVDAGADVEMSDNEGRTPLHLAAQMADEASIQILLNGGVNIKAEDSKGLLPLDHAALSGSLHVFSILFKRWADVMAGSSENAVETWLRQAAKPVNEFNEITFGMLSKWRTMSIEDLMEFTTPSSKFQKIWAEWGTRGFSSWYRARLIVREMRARRKAQTVI